MSEKAPGSGNGDDEQESTLREEGDGPSSAHQEP
jgi:hypothetical protein